MEKTILNIKGVNAPKTKLGLAKFNALTSAAEKLFADGNFFETSISDICKKANTAVGTFYIYFNSKQDLYRYLVERYKKQIKAVLANSIADCKTRFEAEKEGIKAFVKYSTKNPIVYKIIWGSLAVDNQIFEDYYVSFAKSYTKALAPFSAELTVENANSLAYMLMGITNFLGLKALFENLNDEQIDSVIETTLVPVLRNGIFK